MPFIIDDLLALAPLALAAAQTVVPELAAGATAAGATGAGAAAGAGAAGSLATMTPEATAAFGNKVPSAFSPEFSAFAGQGADLGLDVPMGVTKDTKLSKALFGLQGAQYALHLASFLTPNKQARIMLNLMSMAAGGAANAKDPMALMKSMEGPMGDIAKSTEAGADLQKKRLSEVMPAQATGPAAFPQPTATRFMRPVRGF